MVPSITVGLERVHYITRIEANINKSLSLPRQLESLVEVRLQKLKEEIAESYEDQLRRHHQDLALLEQRAVAMEQEVTEQPRVRRDANKQQYWHSYNFDTHRDRECEYCGLSESTLFGNQAFLHIKVHAVKMFTS